MGNGTRAIGDPPRCIFIASPYSVSTASERLANVERSLEAGRQLMHRGYVPVMPLLTHWFDVWILEAHQERVPYETYMTWTLAILERCDGLLYLAPSPGADRELARAVALGLPVWRDLAEVPRA